MNTQIEFDEDNKAFGFDEWEYLNFRNTSPYCCDKCAKSAEKIESLQIKIASLNGKLSASKTNYNKLKRKYQHISYEYSDIENYILSDCWPGFLSTNSTTMRIKAQYQELKNELEILKQP